MASTSATATEAISASWSKAAWIPWVLGGALIIGFAIRDLLLTHGLVIDETVVWGRDFANLWTGGRLVRADLISKLYDIPAYQAYQRHLFGPIGQHSFSYPPITFPLSSALSRLPYPVALLIWQTAGGLFFIWTARPWWPRKCGSAGLAVLTPAALVNLWAGQYGFIIGGLFLLGWRQVELGRSVRAGICFGLMLMKPQLAALIPLALALRGEWKTIISGAATVAVLVVSSIIAYGVQPWRDLLFGTGPFLAHLIDARGSFFGFMSTSTATAAFSAGAGFALTLCLQAAAAAIGLYVVVKSGLRPIPLRNLALITATATFVVLPYGFNYDMTVPMLGALQLMTDSRQSAMERRLAFYGFIAPQFGMLLAAARMPLMPVLIVGLLYAQYRAATLLNSQQVLGLPRPEHLRGCSHA